MLRINTCGIPHSPAEILNTLEATLGQNKIEPYAQFIPQLNIPQPNDQRLAQSIKVLHNLAEKKDVVLLLDDLEDFQSSEITTTLLKEILRMSENKKLRLVIVSSSISKINPSFFRKMDELLVNSQGPPLQIILFN